MLLEHGFNSLGKLWRNAYGAMVLEARGNGLANGLTLPMLGSAGLLEEVFDSGELVQWKGEDVSLMMVLYPAIVNSHLR